MIVQYCLGGEYSVDHPLNLSDFKLQTWGPIMRRVLQCTMPGLNLSPSNWPGTMPDIPDLDIIYAPFIKVSADDPPASVPHAAVWHFRYYLEDQLSPLQIQIDVLSESVCLNLFTFSSTF